MKQTKIEALSLLNKYSNGRYLTDIYTNVNGEVVKLNIIDKNCSFTIVRVHAGKTELFNSDEVKVTTGEDKKYVEYKTKYGTTMMVASKNSIDVSIIPNADPNRIYVYIVDTKLYHSIHI